MKKFSLNAFLTLLLMLAICVVPVACGSDDSDPVVSVDDDDIDDGDDSTLADPTNSNTSVESTSNVIADGTETANVTVTLANIDGNQLSASGGVVALSSTGTAIVSDVTDNNNGTYSATVTNTVTETVTISATVDGVSITDTADITFDPIPDPTAETSVTAVEAVSPVAADGVTTSLVTVTLVGTDNNPFTTSAGTVTLTSTGSAVVSAVTDNGDGTYTATVTNTISETVTITGTLNDITITNTAQITFDPVPDPDGAIMEATSSIPADGVSTSIVTITIIDTEGNTFTSSGGDVVLISNGTAIISEVTDNNDGTYTATVTNTTAETVTISGTLGDTAITNTAEIIFESIGALVIAINSGGEELVLGDVTFVEDIYFETPSDPFSNTVLTEIAGTTNDELYFTERYPNASLGTITYNIPVTNGTFDVNLHFAELFWGLEDQGGVAGGVGSRIFDVTIEGAVVMQDYDIFADVGAATATIKLHEDMVVTDGILTISLTASVDQPKISAIEVRAAE